MAPRRGGGGSGWSSSISACSSSAFGTEESRIFIAFDGLFFLAFLGLMIFASTRLKGKRDRWIFVFASVFAVLSTLITIIMTTLYECDIVTSRQANNAHTAPAWLWWAAMLALVGAIMVPLCKRLGAGRVIVSLNTGFMAGLGVVVLVKLGMNTYYRSASFTLDRDEQMDWVLRDSRLAVAATSLVLVGILMASAFMASTLPRNEASRNGGRKIFIILLIISAIALACVDLAQDALVMALNMDRLNMPRDYMTSLQALYFLAYFTYLMTAIAAILLATSFTDDSTSAYPAAYPAVYAAAAPEPKYGYQTEAYPPPQPQYSYAAPQPQYTYSAPQPPYNTAASPPPLAHTQPVR